MTRSRSLCAVLVCALAAATAPTAAGQTVFHPRVKGALGLIPPVNGQGQFGGQDVASGALTPVTYHGGAVMAGGVTVHTIFWTGGTKSFQGRPAGAPADYIGMVEQFFTDVSHDSGAAGNVFSVLPQYAEGTTPGAVTKGTYSVSFDKATDVVVDSAAYPSKADQCASPHGTAVCVTDAQIQAEVDRVVQSTPGQPRGLHNLWYVFLPPDVDACITPGVCGTNAFGGYHSLSDVGHGLTIYALTIDPIIEVGVGPGSDPRGYPDAEVTVDIAAHETVEAMTDPEGVGYMDPNGFEVGDKCEFGPQRGQPIGFASNGSPYNQVINGHQYLVQEMWANADNNGNSDCVQSTSNTSTPLPLPQVSMSQFSSTVSGNVERASGGGIGVTVSLRRMGADNIPVTVAQGSSTTAGDGSWSVSLAPHAVGDDRDEIDIHYSGAGAPSPADQVILTGNGGNPFTESGWTGWTALDNGSFLTNHPPSLTMAPCFQAGVLSVTFDGSPLPSPTNFCNTQTDAATVGTPPISGGDVVTDGSNDNRAFSPPDGPTPNPSGGLVGLTVPVGEPDSVSPFVSPLAYFAPSGFPTCTADLQAQSVTCGGLVPGSGYGLQDGGHHASGTADSNGVMSGSLPVKGGDAVVLSNGSRPLTTLHVARLRVDVAGQQTVLAGGSCQAGEYYAGPLASAPTSALAGEPTAVAGGAALTGAICPTSGNAGGLSATNIVQTDELSGGQTTTEVPSVEDTSPIQGEIVYGAFTALAESGLPGPNNSVIPTDATSRIAVKMYHSTGGAPVFTSSNVDTPGGVRVAALKPGTYTATWTLTDANGDTRTMTTRFIEEPAKSARRSRLAVSCHLTRADRIVCTVTFRSAKDRKGTMHVRLMHAGRVAALGHARVTRGKASVTMRELRHLAHGASVAVTVVLAQAGHAANTTRLMLRVK